MRREQDNRYKATHIKFINGSHALKHRPQRNISDRLVTLFTVVFGVGLVGGVSSGRLPMLVAAGYLLLSVIAFIAYAIDKSAAQNDRWRTKESTLHLIALLGGWPGAFLAQTKLRHKSSKRAFKRVFWLTIMLNLAALYGLQTAPGETLVSALSKSFERSLLK